MFITNLRSITNRSMWATAILFNDKSTGLPMDITGGGVPNSFVLALRRTEGNRNSWPMNSFYDPNYLGPPDLVGSTTTGELTIPALGILQVNFPVARIQTLCPGSYRMGLGVTNGISTVEVAVGLLPVIDGIIPSWS
jgi:hypothetical protein